MRTLLSLVLASTVALAVSANAQDSVRIQFESGASGATINGTIVGDEYRDYVLGAQAGQRMVVSLDVTATNGHGSAFFNILPAGQDFPALYNGSSDDDRRAELDLPETGDWAIRVYLMGNDRDADKTVGYSIDVSSAPTSGAGTGNRVVGALANGDSVRILGCEDVGNSRWCEVEMMTDMRGRGWVNAGYLQ
jgi:hypothetical protein